jgi:hypothetical protein
LELRDHRNRPLRLLLRPRNYCRTSLSIVSTIYQTVSEKLFGNPQPRARRLIIKRIIAA